MPLKASIPKTEVILRLITILCFFAVGVTLLYYGINEYKMVTYETSYQVPREISVQSDSEVKIEDMRILVSAEAYRTINEDDWMGVLLSLNFSERMIDLTFFLPHKIENVMPYVGLSNDQMEFSYNETSDSSFIHLFCEAQDYDKVPHNYLCITFDWKIVEKISYDQERVAIVFQRPGLPVKAIWEHIPHLNRSLGPDIDEITIQIEGNYPLDFLFTHPRPSYIYYLYGQTSAYWTFPPGIHVSSIEAVFRNPVLSKQKSNIILFSGIYLGFGTAALFGGLKETIDFFRELHGRKVGNKRKRRKANSVASMLRKLRSKIKQ